MSANVVFYKMHGILLYSARGMLQWHENMLPEFSELISYNARARALLLSFLNTYRFCHSFLIHIEKFICYMFCAANANTSICRRI